jgi:hypothetical protein
MREMLQKVRALFDAWQPGETPAEFAKRVQHDDLMGKATARTVKDYVYAFTRRFLTPTDTPARHLQRLSTAINSCTRSTNAESIEQEACEILILGMRDLRDYFRKPGNFLADHLARYSKSRRQAPIYWPLSTASGSYTLWIYYHRLTSDTLYTAVNRYVEPKLAAVQRDVNELERRLMEAAGREAAKQREQVEETRAFAAELADFRNALLRVAALPYRPGLNDGVIVNAAPLHKLLRLPKWAKATADCWANLERGEYDWAHLAYTVWPERVREKCRSDKSLAIAHDLEDLYSAPPETGKKGRGRKKVALPLDEEDEE